MTTTTTDAGRAGVAPSSEQSRYRRCPRCNGPLPLTEDCPDECCPVEREEDAEPEPPERSGPELAAWYRPIVRLALEEQRRT